MQTQSLTQEQPLSEKEPQAIKCVVWDLDNTLWQGVLLEDQSVTLKPQVVDVIKALDERGILQSIASKNHFDDAKNKLLELGLWDYFLYPQINWNSKSSSIRHIAEDLNINVDVFAFVDDQAFERDEVAFEIPQVDVFADTDIQTLLTKQRFKPKFITPESKIRRKLYQFDIDRKQAEDAFTGASDEFLTSLDMCFKVYQAQEADLQRAEELTMRTHQLNSTGYTYSYEELQALLHSENHTLLVATLDDKFGSYGTIGLALVEKNSTHWTLKLLLMSCRVMSRGVGTVFLHHIMHQAQKHNVTLQAEFINNNRNRVMFITYKFSGFKTLKKDNDFIVFEHALDEVPALPTNMALDLADID